MQVGLLAKFSMLSNVSEKGKIRPMSIMENSNLGQDYVDQQ